MEKGLKLLFKPFLFWSRILWMHERMESTYELKK